MKNKMTITKIILQKAWNVKLLKLSKIILSKIHKKDYLL